jgi:D-beta-D-heptose 7-phosphate kinase/D-beta-D-heptose 1-phosphate adenosyltransferase
MGKVVFTNGCFDILHQGHFALFEYCRELAGEDGKVILALDTDERIRQTKGNYVLGNEDPMNHAQRPYNNEFQRHINLQPPRENPLNKKPFADDIRFFDTDQDLVRLVKLIQPDIMVKGADWEGKHIIGSEHAKEVKFFKIVGNFSTTRILKNIADWGTMQR